MMQSEKQTIFDPLRKKRVVLTPEEEVRQYFIQWLCKERDYPMGLMMSEFTIAYNKRSFRCDIVCFNSESTPLVIVECKAPSVKIDGGVIEQITRYNMALKVGCLVITNGVTTFAFAYNNELHRYVAVNDIPYYKSED
ncbi:MAG: type I restriction enzyme HsdR N-terminal domain-containing protein [Bacteroidales bacterium]|nr:type I restriction enzyme HsdR N-terminal domain-containing protein [Bacteroidales bacterium]